MTTPRRSETIGLFDLDGTLADFDAAMATALAQLRSPGEDPSHDETAYEDLPHMKARRRLVKSQPGFWLGLEPLELGFQVYRMARELGFTTHILTKGPRRSPSAFTEKVEWCSRHVPESLVTLTEDKGLVYGKFLVDDWPPYIARWLEWRPRGWVFMPDQRWNRDFAHPRLVRITLDSLDTVRERMLEIRSRLE